MPDYEHQIFLSYRRSDNDWIRWTRENFVRALASLLRPRLGKVSIYMDELIETGASWPLHLARNLSRSKLMVAVLSRDYFQSDWCRLEIALMHRREQMSGFRTHANPFGLIIPVVIDDGDCFPPEVQAMQAEPLHQYANPFIRIDSPKQEELAEVVKTKLCPMIEKALLNVPTFDPTWEEIDHKHFENMFQIQVKTQTTVPSLLLASLP
jgi:TIR domain-containing protein